MPKSGESWTPERRAQFEANKARKSAVMDAPRSEFDEFEIMTPDGKPVQSGGADVMSRTEMFRQRMASRGPVTTDQDLSEISGEAGAGIGLDESQEHAGVTHTSAGLVWMYKHEVWGWQRRRYSRNGIGEVMEAGVLPYCGSCGSSECPGEPNACPKGERYAYRVCPVPGCNKNNGGPRRFFDVDRSLADVTPNDTDDPFMIQDMAYAQSTPEQRVKIALDEHIRWYHTAYAAALGLNNIVQQQAPS